jgi:hypothetical protein
MANFCIWPDGTYCELEDIEEYGWMSDDYYVTDQLPEDISDEDWDDLNKTIETEGFY